MSEAPNRSGYDITLQGGGTVAISLAVVRESDGVGLGAYPTWEAVDVAIAADRLAGSAAAGQQLDSRPATRRIA